ncbi:hypothetical protein KC331_g8465 [Hortaea werneckii]|nr:hypothetical protein KC331_g8465 [Hortaea werneckii]KAI7709387.1 hypothetical protein KC353_g10395 [Hortaea werneckii]
MTTAPFTIALGEADLVSMNTNLHAHLSSGIQIASTETCISPDDPDVLMEALLNDDDRRKRPWFHRASSFRVELSIVVAENTLTLIDEDLIERLACSIREAELWRQLNLVVTSVETSMKSNTSAHVITMTIRNDDLGIDPSRRRRHKLAAGKPLNGIKSPKGTHSYALEAVQVSMHVERRPSRKRRRKGAVQKQTLSNPSERHSHFAVGPFDSDEELLQSEADDALSPCHASIATDENGNSQQMSHESPGYTLFDEDWATVSMLPVPERCIAPVRRPGAWVSPEQDSIDFQASDALRLFDVAFRAAVAEQPRRFAHGIKIKNAHKLKRLADIAPSTWSPAYSSDISSRAVFLPTISHALANVASLGDSVHETGRLHAGDGEGSAISQPGDRLEMKLWNLLRGAMYDEESARHLKPLHFDKSTKVDKEIEMMILPEPPPIYAEFEDTDDDASLNPVLEGDQMSVDNGSQEQYGCMDLDEDLDEDWYYIEELPETLARDSSPGETLSLFEESREDRNLEQDLIL